MPRPATNRTGAEAEHPLAGALALARAAVHHVGMAGLDDVRGIALALPATHESVDGHRGGAVWATSAGAFAWERGPSKVDLAVPTT